MEDVVGLKRAIVRGAKELVMISKASSVGIDDKGLAKAAASYKKLLISAIKNTAPDNYDAIQRIGTGLAALTKTFSVLEKLKPKPQPSGMPIDFDDYGNPIYDES